MTDPYHAASVLFLLLIWGGIAVTWSRATSDNTRKDNDK